MLSSGVRGAAEGRSRQNARSTGPRCRIAGAMGCSRRGSVKSLAATRGDAALAGPGGTSTSSDVAAKWRHYNSDLDGARQYSLSNEDLSTRTRVLPKISRNEDGLFEIKFQKRNLRKMHQSEKNRRCAASPFLFWASSCSWAKCSASLCSSSKNESSGL